jgi:uncharacterized membrane protein (DUF4010 family)
MDELDIFKRLGLALAIGLLFGMERGWHTRAESGGIRVAGIRTFALMGLFGGLSGWLARMLGPVVLGFIFVGYAVLITVSYWNSSRQSKDLGITTEIASLLVFALGAAAMLGDLAPVAAAGVVATALLAVKSVLHRWIGQMQKFELTAAIELAIISVVMLPLLPDRGYGPGGALNPYALWWAVVLVAGLSFVGYVAIRVAGPQVGTLVTALLGGLASSTATTLAFSRMARRAGTLGPLLAVGVVLAGSVTFLRILVLVSVFNRPLSAALAVPMVAMAAVGLAGALVLRLAAPARRDSRPDIQGIANPLELGMALKFGAFLAVVVVVTRYFQDWFGAAGVYTVAALSGVTDVDAVTISVARMANADLASAVATGAIVTAASVNTAIKGGIALVVGGRRVGLRVIAVYLAVLAAGGVAVWLA